MSQAHAPAGEPEAEPVTVEGFKAEVCAWAERIGVAPTQVHVRPMTRKWASCSSRGRVTFDLGLLEQRPAFRDEVIVHELLHLKVPNHGGLFKTLVRAHLEGDGAGVGRHGNLPTPR